MVAESPCEERVVPVCYAEVIVVLVYKTRTRKTDRWGELLVALQLAQVSRTCDRTCLTDATIISLNDFNIVMITVLVTLP